MSDYTQTTDFSAKDALTAGDPEKAILGSDVDVEFAAIQTAIATKYDSGDLATTNEAQAGTSTTTLMTPDLVDDFEQYRRILKSKSTDTAKTTDTTVADDPHLAAWSLSANYSYKVSGCLFLDAAADAVDFDFLFQCSTAPADSIMTIQNIATNGTLETLGTTDITTETTVNLLINSTAQHMVWIEAILVTGASTTTFDLQWAQNASSASAVTLKEGSWLEVRRLAAT